MRCIWFKLIIYVLLFTSLIDVLLVNNVMATVPSDGKYVLNTNFMTNSNAEFDFQRNDKAFTGDTASIWVNEFSTYGTSSFTVKAKGGATFNLKGFSASKYSNNGDATVTITSGTHSTSLRRNRGDMSAFTGFDFSSFTGISEFTVTLYTPNDGNGSTLDNISFENFTIENYVVASAPTITSQPSDATVSAGSNTNFTVSATGTSLMYQWQVDTGSGFSTISNGGVYSGATTSTLSITGVLAGMNGYKYRVVVSGAVSPPATSNSATLTIKTYTVTFNSNGGSTVSSQTVTHGGMASEPPAPTKAGNTFGGWYSDAGLTQAFAFTTPITGNTMLYAKWTTNPPNTNLSNLILSQGTLSPAFASGTTSYTASVENAVNSLMVTPTVADSMATVKVNGKTVISGTASSSLPLSVGSNTITVEVTAQDGTTIKTYTVNVTRMAVAVTNITLDQSTLSLTVGGTTGSLTATVNPTNATNKNVRWNSNNTSVATVDANGVVTPVGAGTATITVTTEDGGHTATCEVTVNAATVPVSNVTINKDTVVLRTGGRSEMLLATVEPNTADQTVQWSSSDLTVATVSSTGVVTPVSAGTATITVTSKVDPTKKATCPVLVRDILLGDVNMDGWITSADAFMVQRFLKGTLTLTDLQKDVANVNLDDVITKEDSDLIVARYLGKISSFPREMLP